MMLKILGLLWMLLGLWWILRPASARKRFQKKFLSGLRAALLLVLVVCGGLLLAAAREFGGVLGIVLAVVGFVALLKGLFIVRGRASEKFLLWWGERPDWVYRLCGGIWFLLGLSLQWFRSSAPSG